MTFESKVCARLRMAKVLWRWNPHLSQRIWLLDGAPVKVAACGRRWGKTEAAAIDAATYAILNPNSQQMIVAPTSDQASLIARQVESLLLRVPILAQRTVTKKTPYPVIALGNSRVVARTADDDGRSLRGHRANRIIVDEAAFLRDSVITEVLQPMLADTNGQLVLISTPYGRNLFWRLWMEGQKPGGRVSSYRFPSSDNPHISQEYIRQQRREIPPRSFQAEYLAEFVDSASAVFPWEDLAACRSLPAPGGSESGGEHRRIVGGVDWARYSDFTVCVALDATSLPWRVMAIDRFQSLSWQAALERVAAFMRTNAVGSVLCDQTAVGDPLLEQLQILLADSHTRPLGYVFTQQSKQKLIDNLAIGISHKTLALPRSDVRHADTLLRELEIFEYELRPGGGVCYAAPPERHDDCVIALALAAWQARDLPDWGIGTSSRLDRRPDAWDN